MKIPYFIPSINEQDKKFVSNALGQRWLTNGPMLKKFEKKFSKTVRTKYAMGVNSATSALHLSLRSLNITAADEIIVPTFTFSATANAVEFCGAKPVLADVDYDDFNILPKEIERRITKKTKGIILVHYGGQSCDMDEILKISNKYKVPIIEDCAHALGSTYKNKMCGSFGISGCFSFYPTKIITTGEGGMISTNRINIYKKILKLRTHGMSIRPEDREKRGQWSYDVTGLGYNYRLDEIHSALGLSQIMRLEQFNKKRMKLAKEYSKKLEKIKGIITPKIHDNRKHIFHLYSIKIDKEFHLSRDELFKKLYKKGIGTSVQYIPLHLLTHFKKKYNEKKDHFPNSNILKNQVLCLPIYPDMTMKQLDYVVACLTK
jgi:perosamine synthetase